MNKHCLKCNRETPRYKNGGCKVCTLARNAEWVKRNRDMVNANSRAWNAAHPEQKRKINSDYRAVHQLAINEKRRLQRQQDPEIERIKAAKRRGFKRGSGGKLSKGIVAELLQRQNSLCACCGKPLQGAYHLDHITPLSLGGSNSDGNVQLLLPKCNLEKYNTAPETFFERRRLESLRSME